MRAHAGGDAMHAMRCMPSRVCGAHLRTAVPLADRLVIEAVDTALAIVVAEIQFPTPLDQEVLTRLSNTSSLESTILGENFSADNEALVEAFSFDALSKRMNFQRLGLEDSEDTFKSTEAEDTEPAASPLAG